MSSLTLIGPHKIKIDIGKRYTDPGFRAVDAKGDSLDHRTEIYGLQDIYDESGVYKVDYITTDYNGVKHQVSRYITVEKGSMKLDVCSDITYLTESMAKEKLLDETSYLRIPKDKQYTIPENTIINCTFYVEGILLIDKDTCLSKSGKIILKSGKITITRKFEIQGKIFRNNIELFNDSVYINDLAEITLDTINISIPTKLVIDDVIESGTVITCLEHIYPRFGYYKLFSLDDSIKSVKIEEKTGNLIWNKVYNPNFDLISYGYYSYDNITLQKVRLKQPVSVIVSEEGFKLPTDMDLNIVINSDCINNRYLAHTFEFPNDTIIKFKVDTIPKNINVGTNDRNLYVKIKDHDTFKKLSSTNKKTYIKAKIIYKNYTCNLNLNLQYMLRWRDFEHVLKNIDSKTIQKKIDNIINLQGKIYKRQEELNIVKEVKQEKEKEYFSKNDMLRLERKIETLLNIEKEKLKNRSIEKRKESKERALKQEEIRETYITEPDINIREVTSAIKMKKSEFQKTIKYFKRKAPIVGVMLLLSLIKKKIN